MGKVTEGRERSVSSSQEGIQVTLKICILKSSKSTLGNRQHALGKTQQSALIPRESPGPVQTNTKRKHRSLLQQRALGTCYGPWAHARHQWSLLKEAEGGKACSAAAQHPRRGVKWECCMHVHVVNNGGIGVGTMESVPHHAFPYFLGTSAYAPAHTGAWTQLQGACSVALHIRARNSFQMNRAI
eukprot:1146389-Pelagomonas_calceolata.AAC.1